MALAQFATVSFCVSAFMFGSATGTTFFSLATRNDEMQKRGVSFYGYGCVTGLQAGAFAMMHHASGGLFQKPVAAPIAGLACMNLVSYVVGKEYMRRV